MSQTGAFTFRAEAPRLGAATTMFGPGQVLRMSTEEIISLLRLTDDTETESALKQALANNAVYNVTFDGDIAKVTMCSGSSFFIDHGRFLTTFQADQHTNEWFSSEAVRARAAMIVGLSKLPALSEVVRIQTPLRGNVYRSGTRLCTEVEFLEFVARCQAGMAEVPDSIDKDDVPLFAKIPEPAAADSKEASRGQSSTSRSSNHTEDNNDTSQTATLREQEKKYVGNSQAGSSGDHIEEDDDDQDHNDTYGEEVEHDNKRGANCLCCVDLQALNEELNRQVEGLESDNVILYEKNEANQESLRAEKAKVEELQASNSVPQELSVAQAKLAEVKATASALDNSNRGMKEDIVAKDSTIRELRDLITELLKGNTDQKAEIETLQQSAEKMSSELLARAEQCKEISSQNEVLKWEIMTTDASHTKSRLISTTNNRNMKRSFPNSKYRVRKSLHNDSSLIHAFRGANRRLRDDLDIAADKVAAVYDEVEATAEAAKKALNDKDLESEETLENMRLEYRAAIAGGAKDPRIEAAKFAAEKAVAERDEAMDKMTFLTSELQATKGQFDDMAQAEQKASALNIHYENVITVLKKKNVEESKPRQESQRQPRIVSGSCCRDARDANKVIEKKYKDLKSRHEGLTVRDERHREDLRWERRARENDRVHNQKLLEQTSTQLDKTKELLSTKTSQLIASQKELDDEMAKNSELKAQFKKESNELSLEIEKLKNAALLRRKNRYLYVCSECSALPARQQAKNSSTQHGARTIEEIFADFRDPRTPGTLATSSPKTSSTKESKSKQDPVLPISEKGILQISSVRTVFSEEPEEDSTTSVKENDRGLGEEDAIAASPSQTSSALSILMTGFGATEYLPATWSCYLRLIAHFLLWLLWIHFICNLWNSPDSTTDVAPPPSLAVPSVEALFTLKCVVEPFCSEMVSWCQDIIYVPKVFSDEYHLKWDEIFEPEEVVCHLNILCVIKEIWNGVREWLN